MPNYRYRALNSNGELVSGAIAAAAPGDVALRIERLGLVLVDNVTLEDSGGPASSVFSIFNKPKAEDVTIFTRDLALLLRAGGEIEILDSTATMLGAFEIWSCSEAAITLNPGDTLLLYSDGVTEAGADSGDEYGQDRLIHTLRVNQAQPAEALVQAIVDDVNEFSGAARSDDVTVVALRGVSPGR